MAVTVIRGKKLADDYEEHTPNDSPKASSAQLQVREISPEKTEAVFNRWDDKQNSAYNEEFRVAASFNRVNHVEDSPMFEHRHSQRKDTTVGVLLFQGGRYIAEGTLANVSYNGVFVKTDADPLKNSFLEVHFNRSNAYGTTSHRLPAMVVHSTNRGLGLYVDGLAPEVQDGIRFLMEQEGLDHLMS